MEFFGQPFEDAMSYILPYLEVQLNNEKAGNEEAEVFMKMKIGDTVVAVDWEDNEFNTIQQNNALPITTSCGIPTKWHSLLQVIRKLSSSTDRYRTKTMVMVKRPIKSNMICRIVLDLLSYAEYNEYDLIGGMIHVYRQRAGAFLPE